jgi:hypothetical protein
MAIKMGYQTYWEYLEEYTAGTMTPDPDFRTPGFVCGEVPIKLEVSNKYKRKLKHSAASDHRRLDAIIESKNIVTWSVEYNPQKENSSPAYNWTHFFAMAMNDKNYPTDATSQSAGTYSYGTCTDDIKSFTINKVTDAIEQVAKGCKINTITIESSVDSEVLIKADGNALSLATTAVTIGTGTHASALTTDPLMWSDSEVSIAAATCTGLTDYKFEIGNDTEPRWRIRRTGSPELPESIEEGVRDCKVSLTIDFEGIDEYNNMVASTAQDLILKLENKNLTFKNVKWDAFEFPGSPEDLLQVELTGMAGYPALS